MTFITFGDLGKLDVPWGAQARGKIKSSEAFGYDGPAICQTCGAHENVRVRVRRDTLKGPVTIWLYCPEHEPEREK